MSVDTRPAPVMVTINGTAGLLLVKIMQDLKTEDGGGVLSRALGLLDLVLHGKRSGKRLCLIDDRTGEQTEVSA